jgi:hypothetical protein
MTPLLTNLHLFVTSMISIIQESFQQFDDPVSYQEKIRCIIETINEQTNASLAHFECLQEILHRTLIELLYLDYDEDLHQSWSRFLRSILTTLRPMLKRTNSIATTEQDNCCSYQLGERLYATSSNSVKFD